MEETFDPEKSINSFCFTLNNYTDSEIIQICNFKYSYLIFGKETGEKCGTPHLQGYIELKSSIKFKTIKNRVPRLNIRRRLGTPKQASDYCKKGEQSKEEWEMLKTLGPNFGKNAKVFEDGEISKQGERTDLKKIRDDILEGKKKSEDILLENPFTYHTYGRTLDKIEEIAMRKIWRTEMTLCTWFCGGTGTGKSHNAFKNICGEFSPESHFIFNKNEPKWWDGYRQQPFVIINEFRGEIPYSELLELIDKWPKNVPIKYKTPMPFISKHIIITSPLRPEELFKNVHAKDSIAQLMRRIKIIELSTQYVEN